MPDTFFFGGLPTAVSVAKSQFGYHSSSNTKLKLKMYQIWDGFYAVAMLNGGRRSSATLTGMKHSQDGKDARRFNGLDEK